LEVRGACREHICAFARRTNRAAALVAVPRLLCTLLRGREIAPLGRDVWDNTEIVLPRGMRWSGEWRNALTGEIWPSDDALGVHELLRTFPVALLGAG
jgi:maltooligosyltrehalose synthase